MPKKSEMISREDHALNIRQFMESHALNNEGTGFIVRDAEKAKELDERFDAQILEYTKGRMNQVIEEAGLSEDIHDLESDMGDVEFGERFGDSSHMGSMMEFDDEEPSMPDEDDGTDPDDVDDELGSLLDPDEDEGDEEGDEDGEFSDLSLDGDEMGDGDMGGEDDRDVEETLF